MNSYEPFMKELRVVFYNFIESTEENCRTKLMDDFETFTKIMDWDLISGFANIKEYILCHARYGLTTAHKISNRSYTYLEHESANTKERVESIMAKPSAQSASFYAGTRSRKVDDEIYARVCTMSAKLFAGIRFFFVKYVRNKLNSFFLDPVYVSRNVSE